MAQKMYNPKWDYSCGKYENDNCEYNHKDFSNNKSSDKDRDKDDIYNIDSPVCDVDCCMPKINCKPEKKCIKTFACTYRLYRICFYKVVRVCPRCSHEYDNKRHPVCPKCRQA